jgi:hypothetical protein
MKLHLGTVDSSLDFDALGRTLKVMDGEAVRLGLAFRKRWPSDGETDGTLLGGAKGTLCVPSESDIAARRAELPTDAESPGDLEAGERTHLIEVGETALAVSSADLVGAAYRDGVLRVQVGPLLISLAQEVSDA